MDSPSNKYASARLQIGKMLPELYEGKLRQKFNMALSRDKINSFRFAA
jgi:hypothetical protein